MSQFRPGLTGGVKLGGNLEFREFYFLVQKVVHAKRESSPQSRTFGGGWNGPWLARWKKHQFSGDSHRVNPSGRKSEKPKTRSNHTSHSYWPNSSCKLVLFSFSCKQINFIWLTAIWKNAYSKISIVVFATMLWFEIWTTEIRNLNKKFNKKWYQTCSIHSF